MVTKGKSTNTNEDPKNDRSDTTSTSWKSLFGFTTRKHLSTLILGSILALIASCVTPALAVFLGNVFDSFTAFGAGLVDSQGLQRSITQSCFGMIGLGAAGWFLNGAYYAFFVAFGEMQASAIRSEVFVELLKRDVQWFEAQSEGSGAFLSSVQA